ncbi:small ribosomal subunit protein uS9m-like [Palaemon carinicauda]|uniref:small ribosomal subunit protein uS9m-like n=1 Tax=Palaemon carinicauda TaxID=392227 RepID=UPI0035B678D6
MSSSLFQLFRTGKLIQNGYSVSCKALHSSQQFVKATTAARSQNIASFSTAVSIADGKTPDDQSQKMSKAMKAYMNRAEAHDALMAEETAEYEIGRRHLANIMGEDPETFTDEDRDKAIEYLFPSGLFEPRARPYLKHPSEVFSKRKEAEFDHSGRPFHTLFYTGLPNYFQILHDITERVRELDHFASRMSHYNVALDKDKSLNLSSSEWLTKEEFEIKIIEAMKDYHYEFFIKSMNRLAAHPLSYRAKDFIMDFRKNKPIVKLLQEIPKVMYTAEGVPYMTETGRRKTATATVTVYGRGSGKVTINDKDILYFSNLQDREQILFPLQFCGVLGTVDVVAEVEGGGTTGQSGAIRYAIAMALRSFVDLEMVEKMRLAGLLTRDPRSRERKKPGQKGARAKFTWKKR